MNKVEVSIITPAYNCTSTIKETYECLIKQSFLNWEWIIVEDNSTDGSFTFIKNMILNDSRVVLLQTPTNSGAAVARNIGINVAKGRFIAFIDSDDLWKKDKLAKQISFMKTNHYFFSYTGYELLYPNKTLKVLRFKKSYSTYKTLLKSNSIGCLTAIYDADFLGKIYMPIDCKEREDYGAWLDITKRGINGYLLNECLATYRITKHSVSSKKIRMFKLQYLLYRKHENFNVFKAFYYTIICSINKVFASLFFKRM